MNETGRSNTNPLVFGSGLLELLLKLWLMLMVLFMGLWVLGVILMYWYVIIPAGIVVVAWASRAGSPQDCQAGVTCQVNGWACDEPSSEDGQ